MLLLYADGLIFIILAWYFDHIVASNRGRASSLLFPIYYIRDLFKKETGKIKTPHKIIIKTRAVGEEEESAVR